MSDSKFHASGEDWTQLLSHPEAVRNFDILLETYRKAAPDKRQQALHEALKKIKDREAPGSTREHEGDGFSSSMTSGSMTKSVPAPPFAAEMTPASPEDRRRFPRTKCAVAVELWAEGATVPYWGNLSNTSVGGCFVETTAPFQGGEKLEIGLWVASGTIWIKGIVLNGIVTQTKPRLGARVRFTDMDPSERENLREFLRFVENATDGHKAEHGYLAQVKRNK